MADRFSAFAELMARIGYPERGANLLRAAAGNPALAARIDEVVASGDPVAARRLLADFMSLSDNQRVAPRDPSPISDMPVRPSTDDVQRRLVRAELGPIGDLPMPAVSRALGDIVAADGGDELLARLAQQTPTPLYALDLASSTDVVSRADTGFPAASASVSDVMPGAGVPGTALVPAGPRALATRERGLIVPPSRSLSAGDDLFDDGMGFDSPAPPRLPPPNQPRIGGPPDRPTPPGGSLVDDGEVPPRPIRGAPTAAPARRLDPRLAAAAIAAGTAGAFRLGTDLLFPEGEAAAELAEPAAAELAASAPSSTADLAAETSPPPSISVASGELAPREQAHELIARLNLMRRNAGGEVPEAPAMQREINRLLDMSNQTMAAASRGEVAMAGNDPHAQATRLLAQLNQMRRDAGGEVPEARQIMAEVSRLQQAGDAQRNARTTAFPRRAG